MGSLKLGLIEKALHEHKKIFPCETVRSLDDCFTQIEDKLCFWFNTEDKSTHVLEEKIKFISDYDKRF